MAETIRLHPSFFCGLPSSFSASFIKKAAYKSRAYNKLEGYSRIFLFFFSKLRKFFLLFFLNNRKVIGILYFFVYGLGRLCFSEKTVHRSAEEAGSAPRRKGKGPK